MPPFNWGRRNTSPAMSSSASTPASSTATPPEVVQERDLFSNAPDSAPERLSLALRHVLTNILALFPANAHVVAEALIPSADGSQLITEVIEPITSSSLHVRVRHGQSLCWQAFQTRQPVLRAVIAPQFTTATQTAEAPLVVTRRITAQSALVVPIMRDGACQGILNLESDQPGTFAEGTMTRLQQQLDALAAEMGNITLQTLPDEQVAADLIERMRARIPYIISPNDMTEANYQILAVAASVVRPVAASAGLILTYDKSQRLTGSALNGKLYAVRASRYGRFNSVREWELEKESIAQRIIRNKRGEYLRDAQHDPDYRDSGTEQGLTSELIVPLMESGDDHVDGVIGLVTPMEDTFEGVADVQRVQDVASIAVYAIRRSEEYKLGRRRALQQERARELQEMLSPLFPSDMRMLTGEHIQEVRKRVGERLLRWAAKHTHSEHGAFVLIQTTPGPKGVKTELIMADTLDYGTLDPNKRLRWNPGEGISGRAYQQRVTLNISDVYKDAEEQRQEAVKRGDQTEPRPYIPYFPNAKSEVAAPLKIGDTVLGVLDVESDEVDHFTSDYVDWVEFLAQQAAFALSTIDRASKTYVELVMSDLSRLVQQGIAQMRADTDKSGDTPPRKRIEIIQNARNEIVKQIVEQMRGLTGAWVGRFLIELNAYVDDSLDSKHGRLYYMYSSDENETRDPDKRFFPLGEGASSNALTKNELYVFNDRKSRPGAYFDSDPERKEKTSSGIFVPALEGTRVSGVLNIECEDEGVFTPELMRACVYAGDLISQLLTGSRLRIISILREMLRAFELNIAREQSSNLKAFMNHVIGYATQLSIVDKGWGTFIQLQPGVANSVPVIERLYWTPFPNPDNVEKYEESAQLSVEYRLFRDVIKTKEPIVILNRKEQDAEERRAEPWPDEARSVIAVPLISPTQSGGKEVTGILAMASPIPAEFSEYDKESQAMLAESVVSGFRTIELKQLRTQTIEQLRSYIAQSIFLSNGYMDSAKEALDYSGPVTSVEQALAQIDEARADLPRSQDLLQLAGSLTGWFLDLSDDELTLDSGDDAPQQAGDILASFRKPAEIFASLFEKHDIKWEIPVGADLPLTPNMIVGRLINAALFQYLDTAIRIGWGNDMAIGVQASGSHAVFWVKCGGVALSKNQQDALFSLNPVGSGQTSIRQSRSHLSQAIQATYQVRQIAERLGGKPYYLPDTNSTLTNGFYLAVPLATTSAR